MLRTWVSLPLLFGRPVTLDWGATDLMLKGIKKIGAKPEPDPARLT